MASSIGAAVYGEPTKAPVARSKFSGSTSGIGGQSTETVKKYDPTYGFSFTYVPGSKMFTKIGGYTYDGPTGNWGQRVLEKVNIRKQVQGAAGYLSMDPKARMKHTKFITLNYGIQSVNPLLPRGGSIPRVVDTSNAEDPRAFYSDYNWGNSQQFHDTPAGPYYTIPANDKDAPVGSENVTQEDQAPTDPREAFEQLNPMAGRNGMGFDPVFAATLNQKLDNVAGRRQSVDDPFEVLNTHVPGAKDLAMRRAASITQIFQNNAAIRDVLGQEGVQSTNLTGTVGTQPIRPPRKSRIVTKEDNVRELETGEAIPYMAIDTPKPKPRGKRAAPVPPPRKKKAPDSPMAIDTPKPKSRKKPPPPPQEPPRPPKRGVKTNPTPNKRTRRGSTPYRRMSID